MKILGSFIDCIYESDLYENDKINKVMSIIYGIKDYKKQKFGKLNKNNK